MNPILWWLVQNTITIAVLILAVLVVGRWFRKRPAVRHVLWLIVLLKFVTPPLVDWPWSAQQIGEALWPAEAAVSAPPPVVAAKTPIPLAVSPDFLVAASSLPLHDMQVEIPVASQAPASAPADSPDELPEAIIESFDPVQAVLALALGVWLIGGIVCAARQGRRIWSHVSILRNGTAAPEHVTEAVQIIATKLHIRPPRALIARGIVTPYVWFFGYLRLVWPSALADRETLDRSRGVIAHELAHIRRGDHWVAWLELAAGIVWWWNPLFWFVRRRLRETAEMACDALALGAFPEDRRQYAELLLELSAGFQIKAPAPVLAVGAGTRSSFERRFSMILSDHVSGKVSWWGFLLAGCLAVLTIPSWSPGQPSRPEDTPGSNPPGTVQSPALPPPQPANEITSPKSDGKAADDATTTRLKKLEADIQRLTKAVEDLRLPQQKTGSITPAYLGLEYQRALVDLEAADLRLTQLQKVTTKNEVLEPAQQQLARARQLERFLLEQVKSEYAAAEAALAAAEAHHDRIANLVRTGSISQQERDAAVARVKIAETHVVQLKSVLSLVPGKTKPAEAAAPKTANPNFNPSDAAKGVPAAGTMPDVIDLAERFLKADADLKVARGRLEKMLKLGGAFPGKSLEETKIELERAEKLVGLLSSYIKEASKTAKAAHQAAEDRNVWALNMHQKGFITRSEVETSRLLLQSTETRWRQLESILSLLPGTPKK
jgi:beta-lactamase regulating signal transducer with metallopeptidase domain